MKRLRCIPHEDSPKGLIALNQLEAQLWLSDEAFARWARAKADLSPSDLEAARTKTGALALFEVLMNEGLVPSETALAVLQSEPAGLTCGECEGEFQVPSGLLTFVAQDPCPVCKGSLSQGEADPQESMQVEDLRKVGGYRLLHRLGEGGMGSVFLAEGDDGQVALKVLSTPLGDDAAKRRFEREGDLLARLEHRNIVRVLKTGIDEKTGRPWMALELVRGWDLGAILRNRETGKLEPEEAVVVLDHCAQALAYAHGKGIIHRDLSPANVLATPKGAVKLTDFGLALSGDVSVRLTAKDEVLGTPHYTCPEVIGGLDADGQEAWTPAADMYSLGAMAFTLLAGRPPFHQGSVAEILQAHRAEEPPRIDSLAPDTPSSLVRLIAQLLAKDPADRPSALEVRDRIADLLPDEHEQSLIRLWREAADDEDTAPLSLVNLRERALDNGQVFHSFKIEEEIGRGGMGVVYRAQHVQLKKTVALKVLLAGALASEEERRRFLREAESAGALQHPNIVPILDAGSHDGTYFLTMAHVRGKPLGQVREEIDDTYQLLRLFTQICEGVMHAHSRGVIHRDLKPDNILVDEAGIPRILDFGIAKKVDQETDTSQERKGALTTEGDILGTLKYMPPEQAAGRMQDVDVRSDVYALGCILYELVSGETPFKGNLRELLHQIHFNQPRPPSVNATEVPWELDAICLKALEKDQNERYQSALELKQDVERYLQGLPIRAKRATPLYRIKKWAQRNRRAAAIAGSTTTLVLALVIVLAYTLASAQREHREQLLTTTRSAWERYAELDYQAAVQGFQTAAQMAKPDDNFPLPKDVVDDIPQELKTDSLEQWVNRDRLAKWAAHASDRSVRKAVEELLREAQHAFRQGRMAEAAQNLQLAKKRAPDHQVIRHLIAQIYPALLRQGDKWLAKARLVSRPRDARKADLDRAREAYRQAQRLDQVRPDALTKLETVATEQGKLAELEQAAALLKKDRYQSRKLSDKGRQLLAQGKLREARRAYEQAVGFDGSLVQAREGLLEAERRLVEAQVSETSRKRAERIAGLLAEAKAHLDKGALEDARIKYIQVLAFDGRDKIAREGLVEVYKQAQAREKNQEHKKTLARAETYVKRAKSQLEDGRTLFRQGANPGAIRERYLLCMETLKSALVLESSYPPAATLLQRVAREFSLILVEQGYPELSQFILRLGGVDPNEKKKAQLPLDPHLAVVEANRINIRRAYGTTVRFLASKVFDSLRAWIKGRGDRYRLRVEVRSRVETEGLHPEVFVTGLWLTLDDTYKLTKQFLGKIEFKGGPFRRVVQVDSVGRRIVRPFDGSPKLVVGPYVKQVERIVKKTIVDGS